MEVVWEDVCYALRMMARGPGFTAIVVARVGLGIGANTAVFSIANALLLQRRFHWTAIDAFVAEVMVFSLAMAWVNSANLLIARGRMRRKEVAVRAALGAGRMRVFRLMLTESVVLALLGGAAGVLLAWWAVDLLIATAPAVAGLRAGIDGRVLGFTLSISVISGMVFGLAPAFDSIRFHGNELLPQPDNIAPARLQLLRGANLLVIAEVALALSLLIGSALMVESFRQAREQIRPEHALLAAFAVITLSQAMACVYAVTSQTVGRRAREISIRMALGARRSDILRMVAGDAMTLVGSGSAVGLVTGIFAAHSLATLPYRVNATNLTTLAAVSAILGVAALPASYFPARAASRIEARMALKSD